MSTPETEPECHCEETALDGEHTQQCRDHQAADLADRQTNALLHYITGGEFL